MKADGACDSRVRPTTVRKHRLDQHTERRSRSDLERMLRNSRGRHHERPPYRPMSERDIRRNSGPVRRKRQPAVPRPQARAFRNLKNNRTIRSHNRADRESFRRDENLSLRLGVDEHRSLVIQVSGRHEPDQPARMGDRHLPRTGYLEVSAPRSAPENRRGRRRIAGGRPRRPWNNRPRHLRGLPENGDTGPRLVMRAGRRDPNQRGGTQVLRGDVTKQEVNLPDQVREASRRLRSVLSPRGRDRDHPQHSHEHRRRDPDLQQGEAAVPA